MNENDKIIPAPVVDAGDTAPRPWEFRPLDGQDLFLMAKIISKIGLDEFLEIFRGDALQGIVAAISAGEKVDLEKLGGIAAVAFGVEALNVVLAHLPDCQSDINQMLAQTSNLSLEQVKALGMIEYAEMVCDFVQKDEFRDFSKVASRFIKRGK